MGWARQWWRNPATDHLVLRPGAGPDLIDGFAPDRDRLDLRSFGLNYAEIRARMRNCGWGTELSLSQGSRSGAEDRFFIAAVTPEELTEAHFLTR